MTYKSINIFALIIVIFLSTQSIFAVNIKVDYNIVPKPYSIEYKSSDKYILDYTSFITYPESKPNLLPYATMLQDYIELSTGIFIEIGYTDASFAEERSIHLDVDCNLSSDEFLINVNSNAITLTSGSAQGLAYAVQYLRKTFAPVCTFTSTKEISHIDDISNASYAKVDNPLSVDFPAVDICCKPKIETRIVTLDQRYQHLSNREFETLIDILSLHGFNSLHTTQYFDKQQIEYALLYGIEITSVNENILTQFNSANPAIQLLNQSNKNSSYFINFSDDFDHIINQLLPNIALLADLQWSHTDKFDLEDLLRRLETLCQLYKHSGYNYSLDIFDIITDTNIDQVSKKVYLRPYTLDRTPVFYSMNGSEPMLVLDPIEINSSCELSVISTRKTLGSLQYITEINFNKATFQNINCDQKYFLNLSNQVKLDHLVDGLKESNKYPLNQWIKLSGSDITIDITFDKVSKISTVNINSLIDPIIGASEIDNILILVSQDGKTYNQVYNSPTCYLDNSTNRHNDLVCKFKTAKAKSVRIVLSPKNVTPSSYIAIDEISIK